MSDLIDRQAAIEAMRKAKDKSEAHRMLLQLPPAQPSVSKTEIVGDVISRQAAINEILDDIKDTSLHDDPATPEDFAEGYDEGIRNAAAIVLQMPPAQPETAKRIVGKSRDGMILWYQCDMCNEPVDVQDNFCRGCGRRLTDG